MNCNESLQIASARIDGQVTLGEVRALDAHLASCEACRGADRAMRTVNAGFIAAGAGPSVRSGFKSALFDRLDAEALLPPRKGRLLSFPVWRWAAVPLAAAAGLALFMLVGREAGEMRPTGQQVARQDVPVETIISVTSPLTHGAAGENGVRGAAAVARGASVLSPEEAEIVANLDLLEHPAAPEDAPADLDEMLTPSAKGQG